MYKCEFTGLVPLQFLTLPHVSDLYVGLLNWKQNVLLQHGLNTPCSNDLHVSISFVWVIKTSHYNCSVCKCWSLKSGMEIIVLLWICDCRAMAPQPFTQRCQRTSAVAPGSVNWITGLHKCWNPSVSIQDSVVSRCCTKSEWKITFHDTRVGK